jgi:hypothetical protein
MRELTLNELINVNGGDPASDASTTVNCNSSDLI